jgi:hypothetical protein
MKKKLVVVLLIIIGLYWLIDHAAPLPFNHESFGLYNHTAHRIIGIVLLAAAGLAWWKWKEK